MKKHISISIRLTVFTLLLFGVVYPLIITGIASIIGANHGKGKTISVNGKVVGFEVIGQSFTSDKYFNSRPSAVGYNAAATGGSNKGPGNTDYLGQVEQRVSDFLVRNPTVRREEIPVDLVTASGGGLDPHISVQAAHVQVDRIATTRGIPADVVRTIITNNTEKPLLGFLGPQRVHVLKMNIALDQLKDK